MLEMVDPTPDAAQQSFALPTELTSAQFSVQKIHG
jgi:hypothetical protein